MQFMYATGKRFGLGPDATGFDTRYDPRAAAGQPAAQRAMQFRRVDAQAELTHGLLDLAQRRQGGRHGIRTLRRGSQGSRRHVG